MGLGPTQRDTSVNLAAMQTVAQVRLDMHVSSAGAEADSGEMRPTLLQSLLSLPMGGGPQAMDLDEQAPPSTHAAGAQEGLGSMRGAPAASSDGNGMGERGGTQGHAAPAQLAQAPAVSPAGGKPKLSLREKMRLAGLA